MICHPVRTLKIYHYCYYFYLLPILYHYYLSISIETNSVEIIIIFFL